MRGGRTLCSPLAPFPTTIPLICPWTGRRLFIKMPPRLYMLKQFLWLSFFSSSGVPVYFPSVWTIFVSKRVRITEQDIVFCPLPQSVPSACTCARVHVCMCVCVHVCMCACVCVGEGGVLLPDTQTRSEERTSKTVSMATVEIELKCERFERGKK